MIILKFYVSKVARILVTDRETSRPGIESFTKCWRMKRRFHNWAFPDSSPLLYQPVLEFFPPVCFYHYSFVLGRGLRGWTSSTMQFPTVCVRFTYSAESQDSRNSKQDLIKRKSGHNSLQFSFSSLSSPLSFFPLLACVRKRTVRLSGYLPPCFQHQGSVSEGKANFAEPDAKWAGNHVGPHVGH